MKCKYFSNFPEITSHFRPKSIQNENDIVQEITDPAELQRARDDVEVRNFGVEGGRNAGFDFDGERAELQASLAA